VKIRISSGGDPRKVTVEKDGTAISSFTSPTLKAAHQAIAQGRAKDWKQPGKGK
jgi:hypothetical protein